MMNPFTTIPRLLAVYTGGSRFSKKNKKEIERLHAEGRFDEEREVIRKGQKLFVETLTPKLGVTYEITGEENLPEKGPFMIYSNHQGYADILATLWLLKDKFQVGYVAKEEWRKIKMLSDAITYTRSVFLTRGNPREAVKALSDSVEVLRQGFNLVVFPEGTRSQSHEMAPFKAGAFKFAEKAKVPIVPVTIDGSYKLFEEKGTYQPANIKITVHPIVHIESMTRQEMKQAQHDIEATIRSAL